MDLGPILLIAYVCQLLFHTWNLLGINYKNIFIDFDSIMAFALFGVFLGLVPVIGLFLSPIILDGFYVEKEYHNSMDTNNRKSFYTSNIKRKFARLELIAYFLPVLMLGLLWVV